MKRILLLTGVLFAGLNAFSQEDTIPSNTGDTIRSGNFIIIKDGTDAPGDTTEKSKHITIDININKKESEDNDENHYDMNEKHRRVSTNYFIFDLGFANWRDETNYESEAAMDYLVTQPNEDPFSKNDLKIKTGKSSNVNLWIFMQKLDLAKRMLNLKYGLGLEMYNFRYTSNITYKDKPPSIFRDSIDFSKNKLYVGYLSVPFMLNFDANPEKKQSFSASVGVSAGYRIGSHNKQVSDERGKDKIKGDFNLDPWRFAYIAEMGLGPIRLYGSYSINPLHESGLKQYPYAVGLRFSNW